MEHWQVLSATMVGRLEKLLNSRRSRIAKTVTFWPWWLPFNSFCFESLSFFPLFPFFLFVTQKSVGRAMPSPPLPPRPPQYRRPYINLFQKRQGKSNSKSEFKPKKWKKILYTKAKCNSRSYFGSFVNNKTNN